MATADKPSHEKNQRLALIISAGLFVVAVIVTVVLGSFLWPSSAVHIGLLVGFAIAYAVATMGLSTGLIALTTRRARGGTSSTDSGAGKRSGFVITMTVDSLIPTVVFGCSGVLLAVLVLLKRDAMEPTALGLGLLMAGLIAYWGFQSYRSYRKRH